MACSDPAKARPCDGNRPFHAGRSPQALGVSSQVAKALSSVDGQAYVLRRIDGRQASFQGSQAVG